MYFYPLDKESEKYLRELLSNNDFYNAPSFVVPSNVPASVIEELIIQGYLESENGVRYFLQGGYYCGARLTQLAKSYDERKREYEQLNLPRNYTINNYNFQNANFTNSAMQIATTDSTQNFNFESIDRAIEEFEKEAEKVDLSKESDNLLDYRIVKNFCQSSILHIGIEETGSSGTGFIISEDGYALTCAHVVEGAKEIYATVINGDGYATEGFKEGFEVYDAGNGKVVYTNELLDIALLKMEHYGSGVLPIEKRTILPELGEEVVVFGYPLGYEMPQSNFFGPNISFYKGYVSSNQIKDGNSVTFLDIDVKSGNSGSPVISTKTGKVIGIMSGVKVGGKIGLNEKMPYMIPIQHFLELNK